MFFRSHTHVSATTPSFLKPLYTAEFLVLPECTDASLNGCLATSCQLTLDHLEGRWSFPEEDDAKPSAEKSATAGEVIRNRTGARVSERAKDLISRALTVDREARLNTDDLLNHTWLQSDNVVSTASLASSVMVAVRTRAKHRKNLASQHLKPKKV